MISEAWEAGTHCFGAGRIYWAAACLAYRELIKELDGFSDYTTSRVLTWLTNTENNLYIKAQENICLDSSVEFRPPKRF